MVSLFFLIIRPASSMLAWIFLLLFSFHTWHMKYSSLHCSPFATMFLLSFMFIVKVGFKVVAMKIMLETDCNIIHLISFV